MLAIRMQRLGRKGHPTYRVVVQDVRQTPSSGKYVAMLGSYDPHSKTNTLVKDKAEFYLTHGAQPSERVARLLTSEGISLPAWVKQSIKHERAIRNSDKLRKNQPKVEKPEPETKAAEIEVPPETETATTETAADEPASEPIDSKETSETIDEAITPESVEEPETPEAEEKTAKS